MQRLQLLAGLETHGFTGRNGNLRAGARIAADAGFAWAYVEDTESAKLDALASAKGALHAFENGFDGHLRFRLCDARSVDHFVDNVEFDQSRLLRRKPHDRIRVIALSSTRPTAELFRRACALFATGVAVLTTRASDGTPHGLTINSFSSLSLEPPLVIVAIDRACSIVEMFAPGGQFAVNILREEQRDLSVRFSALPEGRFSGVPWRPGITGAPVIDGVLGTIECRIMQVLETGDHRLLIGEVVDTMIAEGRPLVFFASGYTGLR